MKTTIKLVIVFAVMLFCGSCSKIKEVRPEKIIISGQVIDKDGQPVQNVQVQVNYMTFMGMSTPMGSAQYTDENGYYQIGFTPSEDHTITYHVSYEIIIDDYFYYHSYSVDPWVASQEHDVVLKKAEE